MKYALIILAMLFAAPAAAHPHHDCKKEDCSKHEHPDKEPGT
jgi:hypothetical protein